MTIPYCKSHIRFYRQSKIRTNHLYVRWFLLFNTLFILIFNGKPDFSASELIEKEKHSQFTQDAKHFFAIGSEIFKTPFQFKHRDWTTMGMVSGATALLFFIDKDIRVFARNSQNSINNKLFKIDAYYGNNYTAAMTFSIYGIGLLFDDPELRKVGLQSMEAFFYSGIITTIFKELIGRRRPYGGDNQLFFKPFQWKESYKSLPSGHATVSFAVSTIMAKSIDNFWWKNFWYGSAGLVAAARVYHNVHWFSDVLLGGVIGYSVASFIFKSDDKFKIRFSSKLYSKCSPLYLGPEFGVVMQF